MGTFTVFKHHIDTGNSKPIKQYMRQTPLGYANEEKQHLEKPLKAGMIEPTCCCCLPTLLTLVCGGVGVVESDHPAFGSPASLSNHLASSSITPAGSVHKSRGDNVVRMWVQLKR